MTIGQSRLTPFGSQRLFGRQSMLNQQGRTEKAEREKRPTVNFCGVLHILAAGPLPPCSGRLQMPYLRLSRSMC